MTSKTCWRRLAMLLSYLSLMACLPALWAQGSGALTLGQIDQAAAKRGGSFTEKIPLYLKSGYHVNSNAPNEDYLIPLKLTWSPGPIQADQVVYPKAQAVHLAFSQKPVSIFTGSFALESTFKVPATMPLGLTKVNGKLRYQACNDRECLPPKTIDIQIPVDVH